MVAGEVHQALIRITLRIKKSSKIHRELMEKKERMMILMMNGIILILVLSKMMIMKVGATDVNVLQNL